MVIKIDKEGEMLRVVATGSFTLETAKKTFVELMLEVEEHQASRVLFDARAVAGEPTTKERFDYGKFCAEELNRRGLWELHTRFAYVMNTPLLDHERFGETVAVNRGMQVKATASLEEAMKWLGL